MLYIKAGLQHFAASFAVLTGLSGSNFRMYVGGGRI
jgi:hypothetical protein